VEQVCFDISNKDPRFHDAQTSMIDDMTKPIYKPKYNIENCDSDSDCQTKQAVKSDCTNGDFTQYEKNNFPIPGYSLFCIGITGYEQKEQTILVVNQAKKTEVEAADAAKAQLENDIAERMKRASFGQRMIAYMGVRNDAKNLTEQQTTQFLSTYGGLMQLFQAGAIDTAKAQIEGITPDGTLVTQADKDALLSEINAYLGQ
jgi:hypothetical protein